MYRENKEKLQIQLKKKNNLFTIFRGLCSIPFSKIKIILTIISVIASYILWVRGMYYLEKIVAEKLWVIPIEIFEIVIGLFLLVLFLFMFYLFGKPIKSYWIENNLQRIGFTNSAEEVPLLISSKRKKDKKDNRVLEFETYGIPLSYWLDKKDELSSALNCYIVSIVEGKSKRRIIVETSSNNNLPKFINWEDEYLPREDFELALGIGYVGVIKCDLCKIPHLLIGGSSGSGKTVLIRGLIYQSKKKGADVYIADMKGGIDFPLSWKTKSHFITDIDALRNCLDNIVLELEARKKLCSEIDIMTLAENEHATLFTRIIFVCDEVGEVLDKNGLNKEQKSIVAEIENKLSTIARQGRAFEINLILGTQRPDASVLTGQIKSNIDFRICGRADEILSKIVLDNTSASEIPKDSQGLFMLFDGTVFQSYYFDENIN